MNGRLFQYSKNWVIDQLYLLAEWMSWKNMSGMGDSNTKEDQDVACPSRVDREQTCHPTEDRGIFGWKKRCLYVVMLVLVSLVVVNLTLVCWLITILNLNTHGMSYMQSFGGGVQFTAKTYVQDLLLTSGLKTLEGQPMALRSAANLTMRTTDRFGYPSSSVFLGGGNLDVRSPNFTVTDPRGKMLFSVDESTVSLATHLLDISGEGGTVLEGGLQTPVVSADVRSNLVLESVMKSVQVVAPTGVSIESRAGDIQVSSHEDINIQTVDGSIKLESANVLFSGLKRLQSPHHHKHQHRSDRIYQLCICDNGQLFLGEADALCDAEGANADLCR